jgi:hypothetical protein
MNDIPHWVKIANPASWALLNLIGQTTTLPLSLGGLNVSTGQIGGVLAFTSTNTVSSTAGGTSTQVLHGHATLPFYGSVSLTADVSGILPVVNGGTGVSTQSGTWTTPAFNAGDFAGSSSMTWGVGAGDVQAYQYTVNNKDMTVNWSIITSDVGGTPDVALLIAMPGGKSSAKSMIFPCVVVDNGTRSIGVAALSAVASTVIAIFKVDGTNFAAAAGTTETSGSITFETT